MKHLLQEIVDGDYGTGFGQPLIRTPRQKLENDILNLIYHVLEDLENIDMESYYYEEPYRKMSYIKKETLFKEEDEQIGYLNYKLKFKNEPYIKVTTEVETTKYGNFFTKYYDRESTVRISCGDIYFKLDVLDSRQLVKATKKCMEDLKKFREEKLDTDTHKIIKERLSNYEKV